MKKYARLLILILTVAVIALTAVACFPVSSNTKKEPVVSVELNGGDGVAAESFIKDGRIVEPNLKPVKAGFVFDGWYYDEACEAQKVTFGVKLNKDVTVYAKWKKAASSAVFFVGAHTDDITVEAKDGKITPPDVSRDGYQFLGWYSDQELKTEANFTEVAEGAVFYAKWKIDEYAITYDCDGLAVVSVSAKTSYTVEDAFLLVSPAKITKGYSFIGWQDEKGNTVKSIDKGSKGNRTFKAIFISSNKAVEKVKSGSVSQRDLAVVIHVPNSQSAINIKDYLTVSARAKFEVSDKDGAVENSVALNEGENGGYTVTVTAEDGTTADYGVTVNRHEDRDYTVQYYYLGADGGTKKLRVDETVKAATLLTEKSLEAEKRAGYVFVGWYNDKEFTEEYDPEAPILGDTVIYACYAGAEHDIIYFLGIGTGHKNPTKYSTGVGHILLSAQAPDRYEFKGWSLSADGNEIITEIPASSMEEYTLYAQFALTKEAKAAYMDADAFVNEQEITVDEIGNIINWAVFHRISELKFVVDDEEVTGQDVVDATGEVIQNGIKAPYISKTGTDIHAESKNGSSRITVTVSFGEFIEPSRDTGEALYRQAAYPAHGKKTEGRADDFEAFKINSIQNTVEVSDTEQLYFAVESGYRPTPTAGSSAERVYDKAKDVLREIVYDNMTDVEKAHAIFDWIIMNVTYDDTLLELGTMKDENGESLFVKDYKGFYLEGVFDDKIAVCDGISKAYVLLCGMEGIESIQVVGYALNKDGTRGTGHAWNKIKIDGKWYVVCPTSGGTIIKDKDGAFDPYEILNHGFFMITDQAMGKKYAEDGEYPTADTVYDVYSHIEYEYGNKTYTLKAKDRNGVIAAAKYLMSSGTGLRNIDVAIDYATDDEGLSRAIGEAAQALKFTKKTTYNYTDGVLNIIILE